MKQKHTLTVKGNMGVMRYDNILGREYADIDYMYGELEFEGTDEELSEYIATRRAVCPSLKLIGVKSEAI